VKKAAFFALMFGLLLITASNQMAYAQVAVEEEGTVSPESNLDYSEINALIDRILIQKISVVIQFIKKYLLIVRAFFLSWPPLIKKAIFVSFFPALIGIIASHVIGIYINRNKWQKHPNYDLMYSYFIKSGALQRKESYKAAHSLLRDYKWSLVSFAGLAFRLGNYANKSVMLMFVLSFAYIPLSIFGFIEMVLRISLGTVWLFAFNMLHILMLFVAKLITRLFIPVSYIVDSIVRKTQYCPHCYEKFDLPEFICPVCGKTHKRLIPGSCGILFARCACNKVFLPCVSFTGRSRLASKCPSCQGELAAANARHFSIVLIGGSSAGKTAFVAAFSNLYAALAKYRRNLTIEGKPAGYFNELNDMFSSGKRVTDNESRTYSLIHKHGKTESDNLVLYDTLAEYVVSDSFPRSPKYFRFCDGIVIVIDPLNIKSVQNKFGKDETGENMVNISTDDANQLVVQFIRQYNAICGISTGIISNTPLAVLINKADVEAVKREIGRETIKALYDENPSVYNNNENAARDKICKAYLEKIGLGNMLNNIEATFANIGFFPVSAMGHMAEEGRAFTPVGVTEPIAWIAQKRHSGLSALLLSGQAVNYRG
jgi:GTPase SAR1 family protein